MAKLPPLVAGTYFSISNIFHAGDAQKLNDICFSVMNLTGKNINQLQAGENKLNFDNF